MGTHVSSLQIPALDWEQHSELGLLFENVSFVGFWSFAEEGA